MEQTIILQQAFENSIILLKQAGNSDNGSSIKPNQAKPINLKDVISCFKKAVLLHYWNQDMGLGMDQYISLEKQGSIKNTKKNKKLLYSNPIFWSIQSTLEELLGTHLC